MNCHQILSGSCNAGDHCFAVGSVEGIPFTAYAAGCNIVILASTFERVQIIPGACHNYVRISCLDCSTDTGKIAAAYENQVCIFEPTPLINCNSAHLLDYRWVQTGTLQTESHITSLSWNLEGTRLLTGGGMLQLWHQNVPIIQSGDDNGVNNGHGGGDSGLEGSHTHAGVTFEIGEEVGVNSGGPRVIHHSDEDDKGWECVWKCHTATPVIHMAFSPDGTLFATAGKSDRLVKIWFENKQLLFPSKSMDHTMSYSQSTVNEYNYGFVYIAHPRAVTQITWRKTSKFMPKGSVSNMLVTSCRDNICRIWVETVLPEDGLINMNQFDPLASQNPKFRTHRHKHRFMQRLKHMKTCFHIRRNVKHHAGLIMTGSSHTIPSLPSTYSVHDFHSYGFHGTGVTPGLHFHLAASINAETDIPLVPSLITGDPDEEPNFILHWLNNKEMHFSLQAEAMLQEMTHKVLEKEDGLDSDKDLDHHDSEHEDHSPRKKMVKTSEQHKVKKSLSQDESGSDEISGHHQSVQSSSIPSHPSLSAATSINSLAMDPGGSVGQVGDSLDAKIECLLRDWHHGPDLLFAIHPIDGSFLIWVVDWLDEYHPGSFRQAQVSFSTRIPSAFPLGDAMTMSTNVSLYHTCQLLCNLRSSILRQPTVQAPQQGSPTPQDKDDPGGSRLSPIPAGSPPPSSPTSPHGAPSSPTAQAPGTIADAQAGTDSSEGTSQDITGNPALVVSMVSKHNNGTLNLWQLTFNEKSKFSQVLSISHASRASGHRFRVNDITCHPVLPLLLTTSHHNMPDYPSPGSDDHSRLGEEGMTPLIKVKEVTTPTGFCSELILWRVDAVGPLSKSGGVSELARINSPEISAFSNVAWIPTLLPSTTLGNLSNSPSACFVASDGQSLRVYQAVIDARTLLAEISSSERRSRMMDSMVSISTDSSLDEGMKQSSLHNKIKIVSQQSTARPGCVIQLDAISDATHDWQNTQFLHVFQEQLITGERETKTGYELPKEGDLGLMETHLGAMVDLQQSSVFEEPFYIVVLEKAGRSTVLHMWRLVIASQPDNPELSGSMMYVPDSQLVQDDEDDNRSNMADSVRGSGMPYTGGPVENHVKPPEHLQTSHVVISTTKVCTQDLPLPDGVEVVHAAPAAGHLSSASIYPACYAPYIIVTACSDSSVRFWNCKVSKPDVTKRSRSYEWTEWEMTRKDQESAVSIPGQPLNISAAYSGRIACAYKYGKSFTRPSKSDKESRYVNLCVAIYECESTGGSEWVLEDTIHLKNIHLPQIHMEKHLDLSYLHDRTFLQKKHKITNLMKTFSQEDISRSPKNGDQVFSENSAGLGLLAVPSFSTLQSLRKSITECGNVCPLTQKHLVQLDWVSNEDGSHILTVGVGSKVMLFTPVSSDLAQANMKAMKESQSTNRPILRKASSLAVANFTDEIRWMKLRKIDLHTADGLPPLPMQISWVRDGILVIGMDSEMHVYSQWKPSNLLEHENDARLIHQESEEIQGSRILKDEHLRTLAQETSQRRLATVTSVTHLSRVASINMILSGDKKKRGNTQGIAPTDNMSSVDYMPDYGLFEASRIACPVLPQYHPKQLMELLNSGRIRWVKAILAHLVRCISGTCTIRQGSVFQNNSDEENLVRQRGWSRSRTLSVSYAGAGTSSPMEQRGSTTAIPEELTLDYAEITSIPPLPLWTLLAADKERWGGIGGPGGGPGGGVGNEMPKGEYDDLFDGGVMSAGDEPLDMTLEEEEEAGEGTVGSPKSRRERRPSAISDRQVGLSHFGPRQGRMLSRLLTHTHLPGLSSLDQMHLLALADTVSTCNTDFAERFANDAAKTAIAKENLTGVPEGQDTSTDSLDDCGLRFLLAMKHFNFLLRCLPLAQRAQFQRQGVGTTNIVWAFHSESEEELLNLIPSYAKGSPRWSTLKELGVGWWLRSNTLLRTCVEKIAKAAFQVRQDPLDAALFYLAMKKKSLVWGLFRSRRDERMTQFFANNFAEDRWRKAALKNAFALLGKQRFDHAAAFFLLAGALKDAIDVCLNRLDDFQLAMVICRLYEGELDSAPPSLQRLLYEEILGCNSNGENQNLSKAHPDPFLRSMALWILKDHTGSLNTLLQTNIGHMHAQYIDDDKPEGSTANPNVFNFYVYLRTHPLLIRQYIASTAQDKKKSHAVVLSGFSYGMDTKTANLDKQILLEDSITPLERQLYFTTAHAHFKAGCPALALEVLSKLPSKVLDSNGTNSPSLLNSPIKARAQDQQIDTGILDDKSLWTSQENAADFDWSAPVKPKEEELVLDWSQPVSTSRKDSLELKWDDDDEEEKTSDTQLTQSTVKPSGKRQDTDDGEKSEDGVSSGSELDIMAQQLKFVACLKILMEEVSTLATGFEVDGGQLRYQLYIWLEREVEALKHLCNYSAGGPAQTGPNGETTYPSDLEDTMMEDFRDHHNMTPTHMKAGEKPTLHEILMAEKLDFEAKVQRAARRKKWLKANETLLRTLLSYCSLHGASGGGLASVRMELVILLQELQQEKTQQQLLSPLPFPTTLPLLSASVACNKTVIADPVRHLQSKTHDMLQTIVELRNPPMPVRTRFSEVFVLRDLSVALSACIYQSLCDSDSFSIKQQQQDNYQSAGIENIARINVVYPNSHLIAGHNRRRRYSSDEPVQVTTMPSKWPGVTNLRALLAREKDEDTPRLNVLLVEAFVATFVSLVVYALSTCDSSILYRLVGQQFTNGTWATLFGGGVKKLLKVATGGSGVPTSASGQAGSVTGSIDKDGDTMGMGEGMWNTVTTSLSKQRVRLNMRLLGGQPGSQPGGNPQALNMKEDRPTYREQFVPPEMSMVSYFLLKPQIPTDGDYVDYDSADSQASDGDDRDGLDEEEEEDVFEGTTSTTNHRGGTTVKENTEHSNPSSYSWCILRLAVVRLVLHQLHEFLQVAGIELQELPVCSPLVHGILRVVGQWQDMLRDDLEGRGPPPLDYIPINIVESTTTPGPAIHKYRALLDKYNTPFHPRLPSAAPARRLWSYLVRNEEVQDIFIRAVFGKRRSNFASIDGCSGLGVGPGIGDSQDFKETSGTGSAGGTTGAGGDTVGPPAAFLPEPVRIIHKEQDSISAFCLNEVSPGYLALATPREVQEMDISLLLDSPSWLEDECEFDILNMSKESDSLPSSSFLVIQTAQDRPMLNQIQSVTSNPPSSSTAYSNAGGTGAAMGGQTGRGATVMKGLNFPGSHNPRFCQFVIERSRHLLKPVLKHKLDGIRRISPHPLLPLYLTGSQDGSVQMWEWGHMQAVSTPRPPGTYAKVTRARFSQHGNKFGIADGDGNVSLWQVGIASSVVRPFFTYQCHNKLTSDFVFLGSCSLLATAGHSSESKNVALWDTLLPQKKALITAFTCHDQGSSSVVYAPQHQVLISAGKKGDICVVDVRQRQLKHRFQAHDSPIKCLAIDPSEEFFVTGSADGDIKVWGLGVHHAFYSFPGEHARSSFFKNIGQGVTQLHVDSSARLFSCGADGSMKVRQLPDRDFPSIVQSLY